MQKRLLITRSGVQIPPPEPENKALRPLSTGGLFLWVNQGSITRSESPLTGSGGAAEPDAPLNPFIPHLSLKIENNLRNLRKSAETQTRVEFQARRLVRRLAEVAEDRAEKRLRFPQVTSSGSEYRQGPQRSARNVSQHGV